MPELPEGLLDYFCKLYTDDVAIIPVTIKTDGLLPTRMKDGILLLGWELKIIAGNK